MSILPNALDLPTRAPLSIRSRRLDSIDIVRGIIMIMMALDHGAISSVYRALAPRT
jgi:uncharacterized membrane protein